MMVSTRNLKGTRAKPYHNLIYLSRFLTQRQQRMDRMSCAIFVKKKINENGFYVILHGWMKKLSPGNF